MPTDSAKMADKLYPKKPVPQPKVPPTPAKKGGKK